MKEIVLLCSLLAALVVAGWILDRYKRARRTKTIRAVGFPLGWLPHIEPNFPLYRTLPYDLREAAQEKAFAKAIDFLFDGVGPYENVSDELRVSIVMRFGLLHAWLRIPPIPCLRTVAVGTADDLRSALASTPCPWSESVLVAAWDPQAKVARHLREEQDPDVMAHWRRLVPADAPATDRDHLHYAGWARALRLDAEDQLVRATAVAPELGENEALFVAASEAFIRFPKPLQTTHPSLYEGLKRFYKLDPVRWRA